jgi:hypothetical protein
MDTVYLETTVIGFLTSRPSSDVVVAGHQQVTRSWWNDHRKNYRLVISPAVMLEISAGDPTAAKERLDAVDEIEILQEADEIITLGTEYQVALQLPAKAAVDALHIAFAVFYGIDFLATWNMKHIANVDTMRRLADYNSATGRETPLIVTPDFLLNR